MADSIAHYFKTITHTFLDKEWKEGFDIFYKVGSGEKAQFLKFAEYTPDAYSRLYKIMEDKSAQEFFIHENDLFRYYKECILKNLAWELDNENPTSREVFTKVYAITSRVISDYLDIKASERILRILDDLPVYLINAMDQNPLTFPEMFKVTDKDGQIHSHCAAVGIYCFSLGRLLGFSPEDLRETYLGGMLADIGKKFIPPEVLEKSGSLTDDDIKYIRKHPSYGRKILNDWKCYSDIVLRMVGEHHENFDGTGYPFGYAGEKIALHARICRIMDVFAAMTSKRVYSERLNPAQALSIMKNDMVGQFDQKLLVTFLGSIQPK